MRSSNSACWALVLTLAAIALAIAAAACTEPVGDPLPSGPRAVVLVATNFGFEPSQIEVRRGELIRFILENPTDLPHEMFIGSTDEQMQHNAAHRAAGAPAGVVASDGPMSLYVPPHGTGQLEYRFHDLRETIIGCHLVGHWESGMRLDVVILSSP